MQQTDIAIIGGGFSGIMLATHLVQRSPRPLHITLYEKQSMLAKGCAYATLEPTHLLNVPAGKMSAFPDEPTHFLTWVQTHRATWHALHPSFMDSEYSATCFVPRMIYAAYIGHIWQDTLQHAAQHGHVLQWRDAYVTDITPQHHLHDSEGGACHATQIALTLGHPALRYPPLAPPIIGYLPQLWGAQAASFWEEVATSSSTPTSHAVIIGAGLSAVDAFHSLRHHGFQGRITMLSRTATLPAAHESYAPPLPTPALDELPRTATGLHDYLTAAMHQAHNWRAVIDSLRPITNSLWQNLPLTEQQHFLRHFMTWWNVRRHRMPPTSAATIDKAVVQGTLQLLSGELQGITHNGTDFHIALRDAPSLKASLVINAMGFDYQLANTPHSLLHSLLQQGMLTPHPLGIGVQTNGSYRAISSHPHPLYVQGPLLFGERLESTAVPELRQQAQECTEVMVY